MVPETLRPTEKTEATAQEYVKQRKCDKFSMPWQNIRPVFATKLQRILMCGVIVFYCVESLVTNLMFLLYKKYLKLET